MKEHWNSTIAKSYHHLDIPYCICTARQTQHTSVLSSCRSTWTGCGMAAWHSGC